MILHLSHMRRNVNRKVYNDRENVNATACRRIRRDIIHDRLKYNGEYTFALLTDSFALAVLPASPLLQFTLVTTSPGLPYRGSNIVKTVSLYSYVISVLCLQFQFGIWEYFYNNFN